VHLRRTDSTNERARLLAAAGAPHGTLVTASEQTAGRGRHGRSWTAPPHSSLLMSLLLQAPPPLLSLITAVAVCEAVGERARIKWPNDIVLERAGGGLAKLAGILVEGRPQEGWAVLGVGVNVAVELELMPPELRETAATLGRPPAAIEPLLALVLDGLQRWLAQTPAAALAAWRTRDVLHGRAIAWGPGAAEAAAQVGRGRAAGIDDAGHLIVALAGGGRTTVQAGEVHVLEVSDAPCSPGDP
jgi:BirA family transcriptional regulator, biotin operon repressor / biotin---[acetyl-CoA-carboxylase] ligase